MYDYHYTNQKQGKIVPQRKQYSPPPWTAALGKIDTVRTSLSCDMHPSDTGGGSEPNQQQVSDREPTKIRSVIT